MGQAGRIHMPLVVFSSQANKIPSCSYGAHTYVRITRATATGDRRGWTSGWIGPVSPGKNTIHLSIY